jgi:hypothetical protein
VLIIQETGFLLPIYEFLSEKVGVGAWALIVPILLGGSYGVGLALQLYAHVLNPMYDIIYEPYNEDDFIWARRKARQIQPNIRDQSVFAWVNEELEGKKRKASDRQILEPVRKTEGWSRLFRSASFAFMATAICLSLLSVCFSYEKILEHAQPAVLFGLGVLVVLSLGLTIYGIILKNAFAVMLLIICLLSVAICLSTDQSLGDAQVLLLYVLWCITIFILTFILYAKLRWKSAKNLYHIYRQNTPG